MNSTLYAAQSQHFYLLVGFLIALTGLSALASVAMWIWFGVHSKETVQEQEDRAHVKTGAIVLSSVTAALLLLTSAVYVLKKPVSP